MSIIYSLDEKQWKWTDEELNILREYYLVRTTGWIANHLPGRTHAAITGMAAKLGLKKKFDIVKMENARFKWALEVFPRATAISSLRKLEEEIKEIEADLHAGTPKAEEYADAMMCLFDSSGRAGISAVEVMRAYQQKFEKNKSREWVMNEDFTYSHIKKIAV
jgi:hypothetical protein